MPLSLYLTVFFQANLEEATEKWKMLTPISNEQTYKNKDLSLSPMESVKFCTHMSTAQEGQLGVENTMRSKMRKLSVPQSAGRQLLKADDGSRLVQQQEAWLGWR